MHQIGVDEELAACSHAAHPLKRAHRLMLGAAMLAVVGSADAGAQRPGPPGAAFTAGAVPAVIRDVVIHPIVAQDVSCAEHALPAVDGDPLILGDALGVDCTVLRYDRGASGRRPPRQYEGEGRRNEDWFGWGEPLLAPFAAVIEEVHLNPVTNVPGTAGRGASSYLVFRRADSTRVVYGHVQDVKVAVGDTVAAGQVVAAVGNNGFGFMPHTHVGAWRGAEPLQIRFDLAAKGVLAARRAATASPR